ncbi:hypothetical protein [Symbiopectobacterium sp. RP]|uniref:hypothetical protein n=1 Tax=Symbiopectobacterium sp. RP TaxID=3248553 RepID=UPI003D2E2185
MLNPERSDASRSDQHFNPKQACHNSIIPYYSTKPSAGANNTSGYDDKNYAGGEQMLDKHFVVSAPLADSELLLCHGTAFLVRMMRDLILPFSKSSIYSTKPKTR